MPCVLSLRAVLASSCACFRACNAVTMTAMAARMFAGLSPLEVMIPLWLTVNWSNCPEAPSRSFTLMLLRAIVLISDGLRRAQAGARMPSTLFWICLSARATLARTDLIPSIGRARSIIAPI